MELESILRTFLGDCSFTKTRACQKSSDQQPAAQTDWKENTWFARLQSDAWPAGGLCH